MATASAQLLKSAVHQHKLATRQGVLERMFTLFFDGFVYNQIWEDPRVDLEALRLDGDSRVLTISSGGCNVLNYLLAGPAAIAAVDLNPYHMYLTRLKLAALECLPDHEAFFRFFGAADAPENLDAYRRYIRGHLDVKTRAFWEGGGLRGPRIAYFSKNLYDHARNGYYLRFLHSFAKLIRRDPARLLAAATREEQERLFDEIIAPYFDNWFIKGLSKLPFIVFGLGIPPRQYEAMRRDASASLLDLYRERVRKLACDFPISDNYFAWQAFARRYDRANRRAIPDYLKADHYDRLKASVGRVSTRITSLTEHLREQAPGAYDRFVFLDSQDWMKPEEIAALWEQIARVGRPGSRIIFRTAPRTSPVEEALPKPLRERFTYDAGLSRALFARDRAAIYGGFHVYEME